MKRTRLARRTPLKAKTPLRRTAVPKRGSDEARVAADARALRSKPLARKSPPKKRPRSKSEAERVYGTPEFRDWLHRSPCLWCGRTTGIEAAHLRGNGGAGRKSGWEDTGPLCGPGPSAHGGIYGGCHARLDRTSSPQFWFTDAQRTSILQRLEKFHGEWKRRST